LAQDIPARGSQNAALEKPAPAQMAHLTLEKDQLLYSEESDVPPPPVASSLRARWRLLASVTLLLASSLAAVAFTGLPSGRGPERAALESAEALYAASATCYAYTGKTCTVGSCAKGRNASCRQKGCVCEGSCTDHEGVCWADVTNKRVATDFYLTNYYFNSYDMYFQSASIFGQLKITASSKFFNSGKDVLTLYKLPHAPNKEAKFFLNSVKFTNEVAVLDSAGAAAWVASHGMFAVSLDDNHGPDALALSVCWNAGKTAMMLGSVDGTVWAYAKHGTWFVYGWEGKQDVGDGGLWQPHPMFTKAQIAMLPAC